LSLHLADWQPKIKPFADYELRPKSLTHPVASFQHQASPISIPRILPSVRGCGWIVRAIIEPSIEPRRLRALATLLFPHALDYLTTTGLDRPGFDA
jgi:hypothetical protein